MIRAADVTGRARSAVSAVARSTVSRRTAPAWVAGIAVAAALVTAIALGGLDRGEVAPMPFAAGEAVRMPLYAITVLDAELTDEVEEEFLSAEPGETLVVLTVQLENLSDRTIGLGRAADRVESRLIDADDALLSLVGATSGESTDVWRGDGSAGPVFLQPGVPSEVTMAWTAPADAFTDGIIELDVYSAVEARGQVLLSPDHISWRRGELTGRITIDAEVTE